MALLPWLAPHWCVQLIPMKAKGPKSQVLIFRSQNLYYFHFTQLGVSSELSINASQHTPSPEHKLKKPCWWCGVSPSHRRAARAQLSAAGRISTAHHFRRPRWFHKHTGISQPFPQLVQSPQTDTDAQKTTFLFAE